MCYAILWLSYRLYRTLNATEAHKDYGQMNASQRPSRGSTERVAAPKTPVGVPPQLERRGSFGW